MATVATLLRCQEFQWEAFESAYELTQLLRGTLYVTVATLLGQITLHRRKLLKPKFLSANSCSS